MIGAIFDSVSSAALGVDITVLALWLLASSVLRRFSLHPKWLTVGVWVLLVVGIAGKVLYDFSAGPLVDPDIPNFEFLLRRGPF